MRKLGIGIAMAFGVIFVGFVLVSIIIGLGGSATTSDNPSQAALPASTSLGVSVGMSKDAVVAAWGQPVSKGPQYASTGAIDETWYFGDGSSVTFRNGVVIGVSH